MSTSFNLDQLVDTFQRDVKLASELESPNPEDDLTIKVAIVGFSYNSPTQDWGKTHYEYLKSWIEREYNDDELSPYGPNSVRVKQFFALGLGYLLGLYQQNLINDNEFRIGEVQLPGLIMLHLPTLTGVSGGRSEET